MMTSIARWMTVLAVAVAGAANAQAPDFFNYQGRLVQNGTPLNGVYSMTFRLYDTASGGAPYVTDSETVTVSDGLYSVHVGETASGSVSAAAAASDVLYLEIEIAGIGILSPRERLGAACFAAVAGGVGGSSLSGYAENGSFLPPPVAAGANAIAMGGGADARADGSFVGGGRVNRIMSGSDNSAIVGGDYCAIGTNSPCSFIGGGLGNKVFDSAGRDTIGGGENNEIGDNAIACTIAGGAYNIISNNAWNATIGGGVGNRILSNADYATISGGNGNRVGEWSSKAIVLGGEYCEVGANSSWAAVGGRRAKANHAGTFVWADSTDADFSSTAANQFLIRASGGVGINTASPGAGGLTVNGTIWSSSGGFRFPDGSVQTTAASGGGSGDITAVYAGSGLTGGAASGEATLAANFGTVAGTVAAGNHSHTGVYAPYTHYHDDRYYTETEMLSGALDGRYFRESECDARFASISHNHGATYAPYSHSHSEYAPVSHSHNSEYVNQGGDVMTGGLGINIEPSNWLDVNGYARFYNYVTIDYALGIGREPIPSPGTLVVSDDGLKPGGGSWGDSSDARLKKNVADLPGALDTITQLRGVTFEWRNPEAHANQAGTQVGMIAQEVETVFPNWVKDFPPMGADTNLVAAGETVKTLHYPNAFNAYVVEALKELKTRVESLEAENATLKQELAELRQ